MPSTLRILYAISLISMLVCGLVHVSTFMGYAFYGVIYFVFFLFILWPLVIWQWRKVPRRNLVVEIFGNIPLWMKGMSAVFIVYCFAIFFVCYSLNSGANPIKLDDGRLVLKKGQQILRVLTEQQYLDAQAIQVRMLTGQLLAFYGLAAITLKALWIKTGSAMADAKVSGN